MAKLATVEKQLHKEVAESFHLYAEELANSQKDPLLSTKAKKAKIEHEMLDRFDNWNETCKKGLEACLAELEILGRHDRHIHYDDIVHDLQFSLHKCESLAAIKKWTPDLRNGKTWKEILGIQEATVEALYKAAKALFDRKSYDKAEAAFSYCVLIDAKEYAFWIGLGLSCFHCKHFEASIDAYALASSLAPQEALPHIYAANCFEALRDGRREQLALEEAVKTLHAHHPEAKALLKDLNKRMRK